MVADTLWSAWVPAWGAGCHIAPPAAALRALRDSWRDVTQWFDNGCDNESKNEKAGGARGERGTMASAVDGLKDSLLAMSGLDADGVYRDGSTKREQRSQLVFTALRRLWNEAIEQTAATAAEHGENWEQPHGIGLAAVGSLARHQLGPCSDLDLVVMYDSHEVDESTVTTIANHLWYPLWDSGLDLDHSVRTRQQCEAVTDSDLPAAMGWLDVLPVAGDVQVVQETAESILQRWRKAATKRLSELEASADERAERFGNLAYLNQPDVKQARGGLRDSVLVSGLVASWLADRPHEDEYRECVENLLDVRDCIQLVSHHDTDLLLGDFQSRVAAMMGLADPTLEPDAREAQSIEMLQTRLAHFGRHIAFALDSTMSHAKHTVTHSHKRFAFFQGKRSKPKFTILLPDAAELEGEVVLAPGVKPAESRNLELRVAVAAAENGLQIGPSTLLQLRQCPVSARDWDDEARGLFLRLLGSGDRLPDLWESLDYVGVPGAWMPEWLGVRNRPSASAIHRYTIDRHMVETTSRIPVASPQGQEYDEEHRSALLLAAILHDIGKRPGVTDHAAEGERHAAAVLERWGYAEDVRRMALVLIREHLTLSRYAMKRSPDDEAAVNELAEAVGRDPLMLDMLFDLTRADSSSLGATSGELISKRQGWSEWRAALVGAMYNAARARCR